MWPRIRYWAIWLWGWILPVLRVFNPRPRARRAGWVGAALGAMFVSTACGVFVLRTGFGVVFDGLLGLLIGVVLIGVGGPLVWLVLAILTRLPRPLTPMLIAAVATAVVAFGSRPEVSVPLAGGFVVLSAFLGAAVAGLTERGFRSSRLLRRIGVGFLVLIGIGGVGGGLLWYLHPGSDAGLVEVASGRSTRVERVAAPDPTEPGPHDVRRLSYGSGEDRRPEYGSAVDLVTDCVDASPFVDELTGWRAWFRHRYWGFREDCFPLQGRVWAPSGEGRFPLVLVVHGNHSMRDYSDPGYAYLGELLASRGFIVVSVDENFLNGDWSKSYSRENDARGWLLLEHLRLWRAWSRTVGHPFFERVDMQRVALIGHSRGGEAVAVAAAFNRLEHYPDDATVEFDYDFNIRGIIAIAPVDGQYEPAGRPTPVRDVSYLVLHGSHDADVSSFSGDRLYRRLVVDPASRTFKTSIYIYRANHGQFNTVWGNRDWGRPAGYLLNTKPLLDGEAQRRIGNLYMSAFLEATLRSDDRYLALFRDYRSGVQWLPETLYVNRFSDGTESVIADFEEDIDVTTATLAGTVIEARGLATWREGDLGYRSGSRKRQNQVVFLGWRPAKEGAETEDSAPEAAETASYGLRLPGPAAARALVFALAQVDEKPGSQDEDAAGSASEEPGNDLASQNQNDPSPTRNEDDAGGPATPLDLTLEFEDAAGRVAAIPLSEVRELLPPLKARFTRYPPAEWRYGKSSEPILQTVEVTLELLRTIEPGFDVGALAAIRFRFDRSPEGVIALDEIGLR